ncbi:MAG TPA: hypothetical protein VN862_00160 [Candidatus Acidoferrales bacterium]|nr:hypothetical protein [Candidatus Acidoferrales bacterium]
MGAETRCRVRFGKQSGEGRALLETHELIFRGDFRLVIPLKEVRGAKAVGGELRVKFPEGEAIFELGPLAAKWADKILHPKSVMEKLGIKPGIQATLISMQDAAFENDLAKIATCSNRLGSASELIFFGADSKKQLDRVPKLAAALAPAGALWIVYPKGQASIRETEVIAAGRAAGLVDTKVVGFSPTHTALKFVIPSARR